MRIRRTSTCSWSKTILGTCSSPPSCWSPFDEDIPHATTSHDVRSIHTNTPNALEHVQPLQAKKLQPKVKYFLTNVIHEINRNWLLPNVHTIYVFRFKRGGAEIKSCIPNAWAQWEVVAPQGEGGYMLRIKKRKRTS